MKRFKVFKILYYGFMLVIGIILVFILPGYNQYTALTKEIKHDIKKENYGDVPGFFASYYNRNEVASAKNENTVFMLYEATNYDKIGTSDFYYAQSVYMGFIFGTKGYDTTDVLDASGNAIDNKGVVLSDGTNKYFKRFDDENLYYMSELNFIYFYVSEDEFSSTSLNNISSISVTDARDNEYISLETQTPLTYESEYFTLGESYNSIFNQMYTNLTLTLDGTSGKISYNSTNTTLETGAKISYTPEGPVTLELNAANQADFTITGATLITGETNKYQLKDNTEVSLVANKTTTLDSIVIHVGELEVRYSFDGSETSDVNYVFTGETTEIVLLATGYNEDNQEADYDVWKEKYNFEKTSYNDALKGLTTKTILQIVAYFIIMMVIGDFLVGKHYIIYFFSKLFGKTKKRQKEEAEAIKNEYEVNVVCQVHVPVGYAKDVNVCYKKDDEHIINLNLSKEHNYKNAMRTQNGIYKFVSCEAPGLHVIKNVVEANVRGYKFDLVLTLAYDEKDKTTTTIPSDTQE